MAKGLDGAPAPTQPTHAKLGAIGKLTLPDGRQLDAVSGGELARVLIAMGVAGVSHANGRQTNAKAYAAHLEELGDAAGKKAVDDFRSAAAEAVTFKAGNKR